MDHTPRQIAVKVSPAGDRLITSGANYLHMSKKDLVEEAVRFYLDARREEMQAGMRELLRELDAWHLGAFLLSPRSMTTSAAASAIAAISTVLDKHWQKTRTEDR
jgi:hypothetical protein